MPLSHRREFLKTAAIGAGTVAAGSFVEGQGAQGRAGQAPPASPPAANLSVHMSQWQGTPAEVDLADRESAPWVVAVHMDNTTCAGPLATKMGQLRDAGYKGWYVVENHSNGQNEHANVAIQVAQVRAVLQGWRAPAARGGRAGG